MNLGTKEEILNLYMLHLTPAMVERAESELKETEENKTKVLSKFKELILKEKNIVCPMDDEFLIKFLRARKYDSKRAFKMFQNFWNWVKTKKHITDELEPEKVKDIMYENFVGPLPFRDRNGCAVILFKVDKWKPEVHSFEDIVRVVMVILYFATLFPPTQVCGYRIILDCREMTMAHVKQFTPANVFLVINSIQYCFPARYKGIHVFTKSKLYKIVWNLMSPLLTTKLRTRVFFHGPDFTSLQSFIHPSVLPCDYGGDAGPFCVRDMDKVFDERYYNMFDILNYGYKE